MGVYTGPVGELLNLGRDALDRATKIDYAKFGIGMEHVPELIRLMQDKELFDWDYDNDDAEEPPAIYAFIHAWRALGQLRAEAAIEPLLDLIAEQDDGEWIDWVTEDVPEVLGQIGPAAIAPILARLERRYVGQESANDLATSLGQIAKEHTEVRGEIIGHLTKVLQSGIKIDPTLNGFVVSDLLDLKAVEAWPAIEVAYLRGEVDESIVGSVADAKYAFGLGPKPTLRQQGGWVRPQSALNPKQRAESRAKQRKADKKKKKRK
ncbi:MAG: DUF1186 family protein [Planctomycetes bacterium]|nr:DUF1186 family protein [Planctomycetota bacterium]